MKTVTGRFKSNNPNVTEIFRNSVIHMQESSRVWIEVDFNRIEMNFIIKVT